MIVVTDGDDDGTCACVCRYIEDDDELARFLASVHLLPRLPRLLVVDDLGSFIAERDLKRTARLMALIKEAAAYASSKRYVRSCPTVRRRPLVSSHPTRHRIAP